jgi:hypothetical protein
MNISLLLAMSLFCYASAYASQVCLKVVDGSGQGVPNVIVYGLMSAEEKKIGARIKLFEAEGSKVSPDAACFTFEVPPGTATLEISAKLFAKSRIEVSKLASDRVRFCSIVLRPSLPIKVWNIPPAIAVRFVHRERPLNLCWVRVLSVWGTVVDEALTDANGTVQLVLNEDKKIFVISRMNGEVLVGYLDEVKSLPAEKSVTIRVSELALQNPL